MAYGRYIKKNIYIPFQEQVDLFAQSPALLDHAIGQVLLLKREAEEESSLNNSYAQKGGRKKLTSPVQFLLLSSKSLTSFRYSSYCPTSSRWGEEADRQNIIFLMKTPPTGRNPQKSKKRFPGHAHP